MDIMRHSIVLNRVKSVAGLAVTLAVLGTLENPVVITAVLLTFWLLLFRPVSRAEGVMSVVAALFFLGQNYAVLTAGGFAFTHRDIFLMPYYEPFLWGFYYLALKRFIGEQPGRVRLEWRALFGLLLTGAGFSVCAGQSQALLLISTLTTCLLFAFFHERYDLTYAAAALLLGFGIELFGVSHGLWSYPEPDLLGIPWWFATMWLSVGVLGRRFLIPLAEWIAARKPGQTPAGPSGA